MNTNLKSSVTAGLLGVFLGSVGAHDWYLGNIKRAVTHVCLAVGGLILAVVAVILCGLSSDMPILNLVFSILAVASYITLVGNAIWGFVEGVIILIQGDAGLFAKGYKVAHPELYAQATGTTNPNPTSSASETTSAPDTSSETTSTANTSPENTPAADAPTTSTPTIDTPTTSSDNAPVSTSESTPVSTPENTSATEAPTPTSEPANTAHIPAPETTTPEITAPTPTNTTSSPIESTAPVPTPTTPPTTPTPTTPSAPTTTPNTPPTITPTAQS